MRCVMLILLLCLGPLSAAFAQGTAPETLDCPPAVTSGSGGVMVEGKQAARAGDQAGCGQIVTGSGNVMINGRPAALQGAVTTCGGAVSGGTSGVFINGKPVARLSDSAECPQ